MNTINEETILDFALTQKWSSSKHHLPLVRDYLSPRVEDLSLSHTAPPQNLQIAQIAKPTTLPDKDISDHPFENFNEDTHDIPLIVEPASELAPILPVHETSEGDNRLSYPTAKRDSSLLKQYRYAFIGGGIFTCLILLVFFINTFQNGSHTPSPAPDERSSEPTPIAEKTPTIDDVTPSPKPKPKTEKSTDASDLTLKPLQTVKLPTFKSSPSKSWGKFYHLMEKNGANALCFMPDNSVIVGGWIQGIDSSDALIFKLDTQDGDVLWQRAFGGTQDDSVRALTVAPDGGIIVAGHKSYSSSDDQEKDLWIFKLETHSGKIIWEKTFGGSENDGALSLDSFSNGDVVVAGWTDSKGMGKADGWLLRLDSKNGEVVWRKTLGSTEVDIIRAIQITSDDHILVAGATQSPHSHWNVWVLKLEQQGRKIWENTFGGIYEAQVHALQVMSNGDIVVAGYIKKTDSRDQKAWVFRLSPNGNEPRWQHISGGSGKSRASALQLTSDDGVIVAGESRSEHSKTPEAWVLKLDTRGQTSWKHTINGIDGKAYALQAISERELIVTGAGKSASGRQTWVRKLSE